MPHWPKPIGNRPIDFIDLGLERVLELSKRLDNPHEKIQNLIHIAGTNGKASTISFIRNILEKSGYTVNVYTSPHLLYFNERIILKGKEITDKFLYNILEECRAVSDGIKITFFEGVTVAAFLAFSRTNADFTLIETGMGGTLDATNIISPILSIITSISLDHTEYLGNTLEAIASQKAGIIKNGVTSIISEQKESVLRVIESHASLVKSSVYRSGYEWTCKKNHDQMLFESNMESVLYPIPSLIGDHQIINAGNAIACATLLHNKFMHTNITNESISLAISTTKCPARLESLLAPEPFQNLCNIFLDGAHNAGGAQVIKDWLKNKMVCFIIGMSKLKDTKGFLQIIKQNIDIMCSVCVQSEPRAQTSEEITKTAAGIGLESVPQGGIISAIEYIVHKKCPTQENKVTILICGSLFLTKDVYKAFGMIEFS